MFTSEQWRGLPMSGPMDVARAVADTVRSVRTAHSMSLDGLAARSGIEKGELAALEEGTALPPLETVIQVADALAIPLARLVEVEPEPILRVFPPQRQAAFWRGPKGGTGTLLVGSDPNPSLELWKWRLRPGETRDGAPHFPGNREIVYIDEGTLTLTIDTVRYVFEQGTGAVFVGDRPHRYANEGDTPLVYTVALADP
jgi:transcriptional regulator with XRE-family HTH domain